MQCEKYEWKEIEKIIYDNPNTKSPEFDQVIAKMEDMFLSGIKKIQIEHLKFKHWIRTFGYSGEMMRLFKLINDGNYNTISGSYINPLIMELMSQDKKKMDVPVVIDQEIREFNNSIEALLDKASEFYLKSGKKFSEFTKSLATTSPTSGSGIPFDSKITADLPKINSFFEGINIKKAQLLYRASEHNFSAKTFHKLCDDNTHTLTLIETEFGKIIGGYSPLSWNSSTKHWSEDKSMKSFIFSLNMKEKFPLNLSQFAIACNPDKGPIFGCCDICIFDNANKEKSNAEFPISYNNGKYSRGQSTYVAYTGHAKGQFLVKDWEVFKLEFN